MPLDLPEEEGKRPRRIRAAPVVHNDALSPEDDIEYSITMEVSPSAGRKAWIKVGTRSSVRGGETTDDARDRVFNWVEEQLDRRIDELS